MNRSIAALCLWCALSGAVALFTRAEAAQGREFSSDGKRPITVADAIEMTRLADPSYFLTGSSQGRVALFSPDGRRFVVLLRKADLRKNVNTFSLLLFQTAQAFHSPKPDLLLRMSSSSNRDAIRSVKWLRDSRTIAFLGENPGELPQVYTLDVASRRLERRTNYSAVIRGYDITPDGHELIFSAEDPVPASGARARARREGVVISSQSLDEILSGNLSVPGRNRIFLSRLGRIPEQIRLRGAFYEAGVLSLSPDGRYALVASHVRHVPQMWAEYDTGSLLHAVVTSKRRKGEIAPLLRYFFADLKEGSVTPLLDTPMLWALPFRWASDGSALFIERTYLPLDAPDAKENEERRKTTFDVRIALPGRQYRKVPKEDWPEGKEPSSPLRVTLDENVQSPPKLHVFDPRTGRESLLLDLNPQFGKLRFGEARIIEWQVRGMTLVGCLYLPANYDSRRRYPLVMQTHGFEPGQFSMDGRSEWSSAFAARPLAANGIAVLQAYGFKNREDHDRVGNDRSLGATAAQSSKNFYADALEEAANLLDREGIIDRNRVGIVGFSRTVCFVANALTHSVQRFAAAVLVDGIDCGYLQYLAFPESARDFDDLNGGAAPFGPGLAQWLKESPGFNLDKVSAPVRIVALNPASVLEMWEWYAGLTLQDKPVELIEIPDGIHMLEKPWDRRVAMQGIVDWFRFWLKDEEDPAPGKHDQYERWRELRKEGVKDSS